MRVRVHLLVMSLALLAACDDPFNTGSGEWPRMYVAERIGVVQTPAAGTVDEGYSRRVHADTILLASDGSARWAVYADLRAPGDSVWTPINSVSVMRWRVDGAALTLSWPLCKACLSVAGPSVFRLVFEDLVQEQGAYGIQRWRYRP